MELFKLIGRVAVEGADEVKDDLENIGESTEQLNEGFTIFKGVLANLVTDGIGKATEGFKTLLVSGEKALNSFQTQTGITGDELQVFGEHIEDLYAQNFGESLEDVAQTMATVAQNARDTDPENVKNLAQNALTLRDVFGYEISESMRAVNMLIDQFGLSGEEAFNLIVQGAQNGLDKNGDLLDSINEYSVHYKQLGYGAEEMFNSFVNGSEAGTFSVDKLGDAMKEFGIRAIDGSEGTVNALQNLGIVAISRAEEIGEVQEEIVKYKDKIEDLEYKIEKVKAKQLDWNESTKESVKVQNQLELEKLQGELEGYRNKLEGASNSLVSMTQHQEDGTVKYNEFVSTLTGGGETAKATLDDVITKLFEIEDPILRNQTGVALFGTMWEDLGADGVKALMDVNGEISSTAQAMEEVKAAAYDDVLSQISEIGRTVMKDFLQPLVDKSLPYIKEGLSWIKDNLPGIAVAITSAGAAFGAFKVASIIQSVTTALKGMSVAQAAATAAQKLLNSAFLANPIGLIVGAIAGLVTAFVLLWNNCDEFRQFWIDLWEKIKSAFQSFIDWISPAVESIKEFFVSLGEKISEIWGKITESLQPLVDEIKGAFSAAWEAIKAAWDLVAPYFEGIWELIKGIFTPVVEFFVTAFKNAWEGIKLAWAVAVDYFKLIWENIKAVFSVVKVYFEGAFSTAWEAIKAIWNGVVAFFELVWAGIKAVFSVVKGVLTGNFDDAWTAIKNVWDKAKNYFSTVWTGIKNVFGAVKEWFGNTFSAAWEAVKKVFSNWGNFFSGLWDKIKNTFSKIGTNISNAISKSVKAGINGVISAIEGIINSGINLINGAINLINKIPGVEIGQIGKLNLPRLAKGGIVTRSTIAEIGEDGAEAVVPLEKNTEWIDKLAARVNGGNPAVMNRIVELLEELTSMKIYLYNDVLVGELAPEIDTKLGDINRLRGRGR